MKIHEYQGKAVLAQYGVPVPKGKVAYTVEEAVEVAKGLGFPVVEVRLWETPNCMATYCPDGQQGNNIDKAPAAARRGAKATKPAEEENG